MSSRKVFLDNDMRFTIVADVYEYHIRYKCYKWQSWGYNRETDQPCDVAYLKLEGKNCHDCTPSFDEAEVFMTVSVKWDGCADWNIGDEGYVHTCERKHIEDIGKLILVCYDATAELCPAWSD